MAKNYPSLAHFVMSQPKTRIGKVKRPNQPLEQFVGYSGLGNPNVVSLLLVSASDLPELLIGEACKNYFDPCTKWADVSAGKIGSIMGLTALTVAYAGLYVDKDLDVTAILHVSDEVFQVVLDNKNSIYSFHQSTRKTSWLDRAKAKLISVFS